MQRFKFERHKREALATSALMRVALSFNQQIPPRPGNSSLKRTASQPSRPSTGCSLTCRTQQGLVVCLVAEGGEVGVDVEPFERAEQILKLAPDVFSVAERAQLEALQEAEKLDRALSLWTLKESYIKARGKGLSLPLDKFSFLFRCRRESGWRSIRAWCDTPERWRFFHLDHAGHRIAAVVDRTAAGELEMWEARPVVAQPVPVGAGKTQWFPRL